MTSGRASGVHIDHHGITYEGLSSMVAVGMSIMESTGIRTLIDRCCCFDRAQRILSPGMAVKAMIGSRFDVTRRTPLYMVNKHFSSAPVDFLFGDRVTVQSLNDDALGRCLDTLAALDLEDLFSKCSNLIVGKYGFTSQTLHDDSTNIPFYGMRHDDVPEGEIYPDYACSPKDKRRNLLHYCYQLTTDANGIIRHMRAYKGNAQDSVMDGDTLDFLNEAMERKQLEETIYVADSKFVTANNVTKAMSMGLHFVSRCPVNFGGCAQDRAMTMALESSMQVSSLYPELISSDVDVDVELNGKTKSLRFIVSIDTAKRDALISEYRKKTKEAKIFDNIRKMEFGSEEEGQRAIETLVANGLPERTTLNHRFKRCEAEVKRKGRKPKDYVPQMREYWMIEDISLSLDEDATFEWASREASHVLVTDIPRTKTDSVLYRDGMTPDGVIRIYREEYVVEKAFRFMKSGLGINTVFLQTPSRERAMMFVLSLAALITGLADALLRRSKTEIDGKIATMYLLSYELKTTLIFFDRADQKLSIWGPTFVTEKFYDYTNALAINPKYLVWHTQD